MYPWKDQLIINYTQKTRTLPAKTVKILTLLLGKSQLQPEKNKNQFVLEKTSGYPRIFEEKHPKNPFSRALFNFSGKKNTGCEYIFMKSMNIFKKSMNIIMKSMNNSWHIQQSSWIWICETYELCHEFMNKIHNIPVNPWIWFW